MTSPGRVTCTLVLSLVASAACTSAVPKSADPRSMMVAVQLLSGGLDLFRIGADRRAHLVRAVPAPHARVPYAGRVTLSAGASPTLCGVWYGPELPDAPGPSAVACLAPGAAKPVVLAQSPGGYPSSTFPDVAVRADARAVAWLDATYPADQADLVTADWDGSSIHNTRRAVADPTHPRRNADGHVFVDPTSLAWAGSRTLAIVVYDYTGEVGLQTQQVNAATLGNGWMKGATTIRPHDAGYVYFDDVRSANSDTAYAIERSDGDRPLWKTRAVSVDVSTGSVVGVVGTPGAGREVTAVSGGSAGVVYRTARVASAGDSDIHFLIRFPGEKRGEPVVGLPTNASSVEAQR